MLRQALAEVEAQLGRRRPVRAFRHVVGDQTVAAGRLRVPLCETFPMAEAQAAYDRFGAGAKLGKVVLVA